MYDTDNRIITMASPINEDNATEAIHFISLINRLDAKAAYNDQHYKRIPIHFNVNSYGGEIYPMWGIVDAILTSDTPVYTYASGFVMSAAFPIFLSGSKRYIGRHATIMVHEVSFWGYGKLSQIKDDIEEIERLNTQVKEFILDKTDIPRKIIETNFEKKKDLFIAGDDIMKYKCADEYIEKDHSKIKVMDKY